MIKKILAFALCSVLGLSMLMAMDYTQYVDLRIGSEGLGRTFPGPSMPYGMAKPGPDGVSMPNAGWAPMPELIKGFSQMHVSGTGGGQKYGNVLIQPFFSKKNGRYRFTAVDDKGAVNKVIAPGGDMIAVPLITQYRTKENISLGYYTCTYEDGIQTEITSSERCAFYRISYGREDGRAFGKGGKAFEKGGSPFGKTEQFYQEPCLLVDAVSFLGMDTIPNKREAQQLMDAHAEQVDGNVVKGWTTVRGGWNNGGPYTVYFYIKGVGSKDGKVTSLDEAPFGKGAGEAGRWLTIPVRSQVLSLKVGISHVSLEQAKRNIPACTFDQQVKNVRKVWNEKLSKIDVVGTEKQKRMFYTGIYHTMLMPVDKSGENPHFADTPYYDDYYAIWDTYRTSMPLLTLIDEDKQRDMVNSLLNIYRHDGYMPDARSGNWNGRTQGGSNAEIVIADAFAKKMEGIDYELALQAMLKDAEVPPTDNDGYFGSVPDEKHGRGGLKEYNSLGYIPYGIDRAGNRTVEYSYDDWCIAQVAKGLGHGELYQKYMKRSNNWRNLWRSDYEWQGMKGFIMPRDKDGRWLDSVPWGKSKVYHPMIPYRPDTKVAPWYLPWWSTFFYEALSAEYSLSIPHDVPGLIAACGGKEAFVKRLDTFFANGHYNVANEPSFMTPYLYHWADCPQRSVNRIYQIVNTHYDDTPNGLPGNDDSGAMSSWLVFNMLGLYPVAGQNLYLVGMPMFPEYTVHLSNGKKLRVMRESEEEAYKRRIAERENKNFDDKWKRKFITHDVLISGGKLVLPFCYVADNPVDKGGNALNDKRKEKSTTFSHTVDNYLKTIPTECVSHFVLNRQYRNWEVGVDSMSVPDTLILKCNQSVYLIPRKQLDEADGFCWDSPQKGKNLYVCDKRDNKGNSDGTFLFVSRKALRQLLDTGSFVYNGIQWRQISQDAESVTVKAELDGTMMQIATNRILPWVLWMENNPLGIDWKLEWR